MKVESSLGTSAWKLFVLVVDSAWWLLGDVCELVIGLCVRVEDAAVGFVVVRGALQCERIVSSQSAHCMHIDACV